jgi:hypothetical protein
MPGTVSAVYNGEASPSDADIPFPFGLAAPAAAGLWNLAKDVEAAKQALLTAQETASVDWTGPHWRTFNDKCSAFVTSANNVKAALEDLATGLAAAWAAARGQQDRICQARAFAHRESQESGLNKFGDSLFGDEEANEPDNPGTPGPDGFGPTRDPMHDEGCGH